jgi:hypothetical protein
MTKGDELKTIKAEEPDWRKDLKDLWWDRGMKSISTSVYVHTRSEAVKKHLAGLLRMFSTDLFDLSREFYDAVVFSVNPESGVCTLTFKKSDENNILEIVSQKKISDCELVEGELVKVNGIIFWSRDDEITGWATIGEELFLFKREASSDVPLYSDKEPFHWNVLDAKPEDLYNAFYYALGPLFKELSK